MAHPPAVPPCAQATPAPVSALSRQLQHTLHGVQPGRAEVQDVALHTDRLEPLSHASIRDAIGAAQAGQAERHPAEHQTESVPEGSGAGWTGPLHCSSSAEIIWAWWISQPLSEPTSWPVSCCGQLTDGGKVAALGVPDWRGHQSVCWGLAWMLVQT